MAHSPFPYSQPWASFDKQSYSILTEEFAHDKLFAVTVTQDSRNGSSFYARGQTLPMKGQLKHLPEINAWVPVWNSRNGYVYFRSHPEFIKFRYEQLLKDMTSISQIFSKCNCYASYQSNKTFKNMAFKFGTVLLANSFSLENRVKIHLEESGQRMLETGHKLAWAKGQWSFDSYQVLNWKHFSVTNNAIRVGYKLENDELFLRAENITSRSLRHLELGNLDTFFTKFVFDYVRRIDSLTKLAIETQVIKKSINKSSFVVQRSVPGRQVGFKARISTDKSLAVCYQAVLRNYGKWTAGFEVSDLGRTNQFRYGLRFDLNL